MVEYRKLANQPLVFALAEFRFSPVLKISKFIPELQEALRKAYPLPQTLQDQTVEVKADGVSFNARSRWAFSSQNRRRTITIDQDRLIFFTTEYPRFDGFSDHCKGALEHVASIVEPSLLLRIGLRYGDCVRIPPGENLEDYVDKVFGYSAAIKPLGDPEFQRNETGIKTDVGQLFIRSLYGNHRLVCMPDIQGIPGIPDQDNEPSERILLDFDHSWTADDTTNNFEVQTIESLLRELHGPAREAFWLATTDKAKELKWS